MYGLTAAAQSDSIAVAAAITRLQQGLLKNDAAATAALLHPHLAFGHSNGWVQNKAAVLADMKSGHLKYLKLESQELQISITGKEAQVREKMLAAGTVDGKPFEMTLFVHQLWVKQKGNWRMKFRQSAKL